MKAYWGVEIYLRAFFTTALDGVSCQLHSPVALLRGKNIRYALDRRLGASPHSQSGRGGEEKYSQPLPGIESRSSSRYTD